MYYDQEEQRMELSALGEGDVRKSTDGKEEAWRTGMEWTSLSSTYIFWAALLD